MKLSKQTVKIETRFGLIYTLGDVIALTPSLLEFDWLTVEQTTYTSADGKIVFLYGYEMRARGKAMQYSKEQ